MSTCVLAAFIVHMAQMDTAEGLAWDKAHNKLIEVLQETASLNLNVVHQVVKLAEHHLVHIELQQAAANRVKSVTMEANEALSDDLEQQVHKQKASTIQDLQKKLAIILVLVTQEQPGSCKSRQQDKRHGKGILKHETDKSWKHTKVNKTPATLCSQCGSPGLSAAFAVTGNTLPNTRSR